MTYQPDVRAPANWMVAAPAPLRARLTLVHADGSTEELPEALIIGWGRVPDIGHEGRMILELEPVVAVTITDEGDRVVPLSVLEHHSGCGIRWSLVTGKVNAS